MIKVGDTLPDATLFEFIEDERAGCTLGPNSFGVREQTAGKRVVIFGLPGAFTPTCSAKHVPGYVEQYEALSAAGVDEIWCVSVNDAFVMGAWARDQHTYAPQQGHTADYGALDTPAVWRTSRDTAASHVQALQEKGVDTYDIPAFLRKQAD